MKAIKGVDEVIHNLKLVRSKILTDIEEMFLRNSVTWIANRANNLLDQRTSGFHSSNAREWRLIYNKNTHSIRLENQDPNSGAIEFGIGRYALNNPANNSSVATSEGWKWDIDTEYKDDNGCWVFKDKSGNLIGLKYIIDENGKKEKVRYFDGYKGKSFLYDSFIEYKDKGMYNIFYQDAFNQVMSSLNFN